MIKAEAKAKAKESQNKEVRIGKLKGMPFNFPILHS